MTIGDDDSVLGEAGKEKFSPIKVFGAYFK